MSYIGYQNIAEQIGIGKGDHIFVSSAISELANTCRAHGEIFDADLFIDSLINRIGENGTLVFPTYNWKFCKGETFDYRETRSEVGYITNVALKRKDFRRTRHPIYSFAVWGKDTELLCSLENQSAFGADSPFKYFYQNGYKNLFINVNYQNSATFVHYCEEKTGVPYRYLKDFTYHYVDEHGMKERRTYSMYVRPQYMEGAPTVDPMHEVFLANEAVQEYLINDIPFRLLDMRKAYDLSFQDIINNKSRRIAWHEEQENMTVGLKMYILAEHLFPICRSITGDGVRKTLSILQESVPQMTIHEVPTGTQVFDWTVPKEWNIRDAYIEDTDGNRILSFSDSNLHILGYSAPIDKVVTLEELLDMVYTQPDQPDVIPYVTSYYKERSGFCMTENQKRALDKEQYHIFIDSELKEGSLTYGEILIPGESSEEIFLSTYVCHPWQIMSCPGLVLRFILQSG